jgi:hypothetical protein
MRSARFLVAALAVLTVSGVASAQTASEPSTSPRIGGFNFEGYGEAGVRFFGEKPSESQEAKFMEYRDINSGLYLEGLRLRFFTPVVM